MLLLGSGDRRYREYILASLSPVYRLWLLDAEEPTWQQPYLAGATRLDTHDPHAIAQAGHAVSRTHGPVAGILCYDEWLVHTCAVAAELLGLPASTPDAIAACRDKAVTRQRLSLAGILQPRSDLVDSAQAAAKAAASIGYPVVVKARSLAGSIGVRRVDEPADIEAAHTAASISLPTVARLDPPVLVEEYLDGPEISIDAAVTGDDTHFLVLARKQLGLAPYFEETGHTVDARDPLLHDVELQDQLHRIHRALSLVNTVTHSEFRLTPRGPRLIEINARLGGDFIPYLGQLATGIDVARAAAQLVIGGRPDLRPAARRVAAVRFCYPPGDCEVKQVTVRHRQLPVAIHRAVVTATPGQILRLPPRGYLSRYGYLIAVADSIEEVRHALDRSDTLLHLDA
ncbi:MAG: ATP-grasp domain-containing protein [Pseudonocardiaceae bacterium]